MARTFGKLLCEVWDDPKHDDFLALTSDAKVLYWAFCSQPDITPAGVVPLTPRRWRRWFHGTTQRAETALDELVAGDFVLIDDDTAEVWVRTFVVHDGRLDNTNLAKSVFSSVKLIRSEHLRRACVEFMKANGRPFEGPSDPLPADVEGRSGVLSGESDITESTEPVDNLVADATDRETQGQRASEGPSKADGKGPGRDPELLRPKTHYQEPTSVVLQDSQGGGLEASDAVMEQAPMPVHLRAAGRYRRNGDTP